MLILTICFYLWVFNFIYSLWKGWIESGRIEEDFKFLTKNKKNTNFSSLDAVYLLGPKYGYDNVYTTLKRKKLLNDKDIEIFF
jgi:hypothetical protein